jgi:multifunctional 2-oxoglutarate metabolism enzyme
MKPDDLSFETDLIANQRKDFESSMPQTTGEVVTAIRGSALKIVENINASLAIPTATSYRTIPVKILEENYRILNEHLKADNQAKVSFTHIIAWALIRAIVVFPNINCSYGVIENTPVRRTKPDVNLGIAVDLERKDGTRNLLVPNIKGAQSLDFPAFLRAYDQAILKIRNGTLAPEAFLGTTITLTNPGTIGTTASLPRLLADQGAILATGSIDYPVEYEAWSAEALSRMGLSKVMTISCTYDHRIIQGAESGRFLAKIQDLLLGQDDFYERIFADLHVPVVPIRWAKEQSPLALGTVFAHEDTAKQVGILQLITMYRVRGHLIANLDPLGTKPLYHQELDPSRYGLTVWDLDREFATGGLGGLERGTLRQILEVLQQTYCRKIGIEYRHIQDSEEKAWIQERTEPADTRRPLEKNLRIQAFKNLIAAESFERFLHTRFVGHKRFGLEGGETTIPVLAQVLSDAADDEVREAVMGMAHRGRLNVLANIIGKSLAKIFAELEENLDPLATLGSGDVKYHLGSAGTFISPGGMKIEVAVGPNPSHLEWVNPVIEGIVRAKQARRGDAARRQVMPILIHGDAAFAGQGVVWETINLSQLYGYRTGGTIHIMINNQIGFTTNPEEARSSPYATDLARSIQAPIFHVNGDDPDSAIRMARLAYAYRQRFKKDVVVDIFCYRRLGHNEEDEPSYTQPVLYKKISEHPSVITLYADRLMRDGIITQAEIAQMLEEPYKRLDEAHAESKTGGHHFKPDIPLAVSEEELKEFQPSGATNVGMDMLRLVARSITSLPDGFHLHPKLNAFIARRRELISGDPEIDWAYAEALAFGTLVYEGTPVRLSGQDSARGTFSQRHLVLYDLTSGKRYLPLQHISADQAQFEVFDSSLSEAAVLGFEFGYSVADPLSLVIWEAQFGDFANCAQPIIDNFIASAEAKWTQPCDLVLLLPHGFEGQGPEHSSARLERYLTLCAENNIQVCVPTTSAQYFHLLRRQVRDARRIPLILLTPKSLLRHPGTMSRPSELAEGQFEPVLADPAFQKNELANRVLLCTGKVYSDLAAERDKQRIKDVAILRLEQLYPFPEWHLSKALESFSHAQEIFWVQEEPRNMGAWTFINQRIGMSLPFPRPITYIGRPESSAPATGSHKMHLQEQTSLIRAAFAKSTPSKEYI